MESNKSTFETFVSDFASKLQLLSVWEEASSGPSSSQLVRGLVFNEKITCIRDHLRSLPSDLDSIDRRTIRRKLVIYMFGKILPDLEFVARRNVYLSNGVWNSYGVTDCDYDWVDLFEDVVPERFTIRVEIDPEDIPEGKHVSLMITTPKRRGLKTLVGKSVTKPVTREQPCAEWTVLIRSKLVVHKDDLMKPLVNLSASCSLHAVIFLTFAGGFLLGYH